MQSDRFEWDDEKAAENYSRHGVSFETAMSVFRDPIAVERLDDREEYGEERFVLIGMAGDLVLFVAYADRGERIRLISARRATRHEEDDYFQQNI